MAVLPLGDAKAHLSELVGRVHGGALPQAVAVAADEFITGPLASEPFRVGSTYRIICRIDDKNRIVTEVDVDHRRDVYRT
jgi:hypothetical protein